MLSQVYCFNCHEYILDVDVAKLSSPLDGSMFSPRADREWAVFHPSASQVELVCPLCSWLFHYHGYILIRNAEGKLIKTKVEAKEVVDSGEQTNAGAEDAYRETGEGREAGLQIKSRQGKDPENGSLPAKRKRGRPKGRINA